ncbi:hypothetical protein L1987_06195 [Smallanthus sonchifolius]|uniref:Uncharacterized protein n=1 Tax=Smallanthus sonchifolius TaxID=185202 RepID=A0ACB9JXH1_9ASTR|nr:hypothetical protein L1987_06195 [Smallanthus sonchifolius]
MFRFSCFHSPTVSPKPKKTVQLPTEAMQKTLEDHNTNKPNKDPVLSKEVHEGNNAYPFQSSAGQYSRSEGLKSMNDTDSERDHGIKVMRKCVSLRTGLAAYQDMTSCEESSSSHGNRSRDVYQDAQDSVSPQISSNLVNHALDLSPDHLQRSDEEVGDSSETRLSGVCTGGSSSCTPCTPPSFEIENDSVGHADKSDGDDDEAYDYAGLAKDWIVPAVDERAKGKSVQEDYSDCQWEELPDEDFKIKRIEKWVMDLQHSSSSEETDMLRDLDHHGQNGKNTILDPMAASKNDAKTNLGMDAAKRYISSLNAAATTAQLANHGLVVVQFLSAFSSLRALNLSGNSIVRITVGALPQGLHILNLSKNSISTIEGLRDLTRLRVLDLSYNRILRIGHGLGSCSSLKELYVAGNKISEVEGLHRLLKFDVLHLRFNKLSTTKNLGQLAAN